MRHFSELSPAAVRVVDAAEGLVQQNGYNGFSYDDVAALVGIKKPGIHHHFPHKEELVAIVAQRYCHRFRERLLKIEGSSGAPIERLLAYSVLFEGTFSSERRLCLCGMLGAESDSLPASVVAIAEEFFGINVTWLTNVIRAGQGDGTLRTDTPPECLAEALLCALEGSMVVGRALRCSRGPAEVGRTVLLGMQI